jgi:hypothetical protein
MRAGRLPDAKGHFDGEKSKYKKMRKYQQRKEQKNTFIADEGMQRAG